MSTHVGFLDFLTNNGVNYEVISYHYYQYRSTSPFSLAASAPSSGSNSWNLFAALATYNKPVLINEFNCAEIYNTTTYLNQKTDTAYATCLTNIAVQMEYFRKNSQLNIEAMYAYELYDNNAYSAPENHFGLFWNTNNTTYAPKTNFYQWVSYAGGTLSASEKAELASFGLSSSP